MGAGNPVLRRASRQATRDPRPHAVDALLARVAAQLRRPGRRRTPAAAQVAAERLVDDVAHVVLDWLEPA